MANEDFTKLTEEVKNGIEQLSKKLHSTLDEERKTYEELLAKKAEDKAVSEIQLKLEKLEAAHNEAQKAFDKEIADMKLSATNNSSVNDDEEVKKAFFDVLRCGTDAGLADKTKGRLAEVLTKSYNSCNDNHKSVEQIKSMLSGIDTTGGLLVVPPFLEASIWKFAEENVALQNLAAKTTISGPQYKRDARTSEAGASWEGESDTWPATETPEYGQIEINVHKLIAYPSISRDLMEDARINMEAEIMDFTREAFSKKISKAMIVGTGKRQPHGLLMYPTIKDTKVADNWGSIGYVATGKADGFAASNPADALIDLQGVLKSAYGNRAAWMMNRAVGTTIRKFKNTDGDYLWQPSLQAGQPPLLLGSPVYFDANMPDMEANKFPIAFGDFNAAMLVVNRRGMTVIRDMTSKPGHVKFLIDTRMGAGVRNFEAVKLLKVAAS